MAYAPTARTAPLPLLAAISARLAGYRDAYPAYREKRAVYLRTLRELEAYRPHELHDLRLQPADFDEIARKQAGLL